MSVDQQVHPQYRTPNWIFIEVCFRTTEAGFFVTENNSEKLELSWNSVTKNSENFLTASQAKLF